MPTVELLYPRSLNSKGRIWNQGEVVEVEQSLAEELSENERFKVRGLFGMDHPLRRAAPQGERLLYAILDAVDELDPDDDSAFDRHGKPSHHALSEALGFAVSVEQRDQALALASRRETTDLIDSSLNPKPIRISRPASVTVAKEKALAALDGKTETKPEPSIEI